MKKLMVILGIITALLLTGCQGLLITPTGVKGETFTYITGDNGMDYDTYTFNDEGTGGTWESGDYTWRYATQAAATEDLYTGKSWVMTSGMSGTFTWDPETYIAVSPVVEVWAREENAPDMTSGYPAANYYKWIPMKDAFMGFSAPDADSISYSFTLTFVPNTDSPDWTSYIQVGDTDVWTYTFNEEMSTTVGGDTTIEISNTTKSYEIAGTTLTRTEEEVVTETVGTATPEISTSKTTYVYNIVEFFLAGGDTPDKELTELWKEGNQITFKLNRTSYAKIDYEGNTAPSAPTPDTDTGYGMNIDSNGTYFINLSGGNTNEYTFTHMGDFIIEAEDLISVSRGLED